MSVQRLDGRLDIENPLLRQKRREAGVQVFVHPSRQGLFACVSEGSPHAVLAAQAIDAESLGKHAVTAQRGDVGVALLPAPAH